MRRSLAGYGFNLLLATVLLLGSCPTSTARAQTSLGRVSILDLTSKEGQFPQVQIAVSVNDSNGKPMTGLNDQAFAVFEELARVSDLKVEPQKIGMVLGVVIDSSTTLDTFEGNARRIDQAKKQAIALLNPDRLRLDDCFGVFAFDHGQAATVYDFNCTQGSNAAIDQGINRVSTAGNVNTPLFDLVRKSVDAISTYPGLRRVLLLFSDGTDTTSYSDREGVVAQAKAANLTIYTVGLGDNLSPSQPGSVFLRQMADDTGGEYLWYRPGQADSEQAMTMLLDAIVAQRNVYRLTYTSKQCSGQPDVRVNVQSGGAEVSAQTTYSVPPFPPSVSLENVVRGQVYRGKQVVRLGVSCTQAPVTRVDFFIGDILTRTVDAPPFEIELDGEELARSVGVTYGNPKQVNLSAKAYVGNYVGEASTVSIGVEPLPPTPTPLPPPQTPTPVPTLACTQSNVIENQICIMRLGPQDSRFLPLAMSFVSLLLVVVMVVLLMIVFWPGNVLHGRSGISESVLRAISQLWSHVGTTNKGAVDVASPSALAYLEVESETNRGKRIYLFESSYILGRRSKEADIVFLDDYLSPGHAKIKQEGTRFYLWDLISVSGTWVDRKRVRSAEADTLDIKEAVELRHGALIHLGPNLALRFYAGTPADILWGHAASELAAPKGRVPPNLQRVAKQFAQSLKAPLSLGNLSGNFYVFDLQIAHIFTNIKIPDKLPLLFYSKRLFSIEAELVDDVHQVMRQLGARMALLFLFFEPQVLEKAYRLLNDVLKKTYAYDLVVVNQDDFREVLLVADPIDAFRRLVLSQVNLVNVSPFEVNGPVGPTVFFGREPELRQVVEHAASRSYALIGGRRFGKTSILYRLHHIQLPDAGFRTVFHDCLITPNGQDFLAAVARDWQPEPSSLKAMTFAELIESPPTDRPLVLLLDEADKLVPDDRAHGWPVFNALRALASSGRVQVVLSGERSLREALRDGASPLFNFTNEISVGRLDWQAVKQLVTRPMQQLEIELADETGIVRRIYDFTSGHPNIVQRICDRLVKRLNEQGTRRISLTDVDAVITDPGFQRDDFLGTYWERATVLEKLISLVMSDDKNIRTLSDVRQALQNRCNVQPKAREVDEALQRLVDLRSILRGTPAGYEFAVEAFPQVVAGTITLKDMLEVFTEEYQEQSQ